MSSPVAELAAELTAEAEVPPATEEKDIFVVEEEIGRAGDAKVFVRLESEDFLDCLQAARTLGQRIKIRRKRDGKLMAYRSAAILTDTERAEDVGELDENGELVPRSKPKRQDWRVPPHCG